MGKKCLRRSRNCFVARFPCVGVPFAGERDGAVDEPVVFAQDGELVGAVWPLVLRAISIPMNPILVYLLWVSERVFFPLVMFEHRSRWNVLWTKFDRFCLRLGGRSRGP